MKFEGAYDILHDIPFLDSRRARILYDFILREKPSECLELGFAHGVSSCYIAAALQELGRGHLTSVDLLLSIDRKPNLEDLLARTGLASYVTPVREHTSYNWFLKKRIEELLRAGKSLPTYDFCFIDGSKNWTIDGFAFVLVDKLLREGGWILFDDYDWTYGATGRDGTDGINHLELGPDELNEPHIEAVVRLLVAQHPEYAEVRIEDGVWAYAHKVRSSHRTFVVDQSYTYKALILRILKATLRKVGLTGLQGV